MASLYFSLCSPSSQPIAQRVMESCESALEAQCLLARDDDILTPNKIRDRLAQCDALLVVVGADQEFSRPSDTPKEDLILNQRVRFEIISAVNQDLHIVPILINGAALPDKKNIPGALKQLLKCKSYSLNASSWSDDLQTLLEDLEEELDFKREIEEKMARPGALGWIDSEGNPFQAPGFGLEFSGALELKRIIETEKFNLEEARRLNNREKEVNALTALGLAYTQLGQTRKAIHCFEEHLQILRSTSDVKGTCGILANLGDAQAISGNVTQAKTHYQEQLLLADSIDDRKHIASAYNGLGFVDVKQNRISEAIENYQKALAIYRELENHDKELELLVGIGLNCRKLEDLQKACDHLEQAFEVAKFLENRHEEARVLVDLAEIHFKRGNFKNTRTCMQWAVDLLDAVEESWVPPLKTRINHLNDALNQIDRP